MQHVQGWLEYGGYAILFVLLFSCGLGLPLPEDIPLLLAGYFVAQPQGTPGKMHLLPAAIVAWCGIIAGDCMLYSFGRKYGLNITKLPLIGHHVTESRIVQAEQLFEKWGGVVVGVGRMLAGVRGAMVVAAGAIRYRFDKFILADGLVRSSAAERFWASASSPAGNSATSKKSARRSSDSSCGFSSPSA